MREIIFRGKSVNDGRWVFGDLSDYGDCKTITTVKDFTIIDSCEVIPETVGQYTGLKDLHGTRIFEGDVVTHENYAFDVYYNTEYAGFYPFYDADNGAGYGVEAKNCEIIGNVFDNSLEELQNGNQRISKRQWRIGTGELKNETWY